ncbi:sensor histidine kinase [Pseudoalteromonas ulvae]|uniref:histidine kinase n=1 Tax=Pseudoalteromonas ulvae TaxID=107327 RepID=A0A244CNY8_PSEDV|nr:ATP-binding protein [Pseudoalteromonas ulvae]OUL56919.1 two-component sensor histidine kinase [Pseudoalteromonas ulvae]
MRNLTISLLFMVLIATIGLGWVFDNVYQQFTDHTQQANAEPIAIIEQLGQQIALTLDHMPQPEAFIEQWQSEKGYTVSLSAFDATPLPEMLKTHLKQGQPLLLETEHDLAFYYYLPAKHSLFILRAPALQSASQNNMVQLSLTAAFYLAVLALMVVWLFPLGKRLLAIRRAATLFGQGKLDQRIEVSSISYIRDIETEFNHMADRIEALVQDVKLLSSAVSHDLRTPLARIRFGIDTLQEEDDPVMRKRYEQRISNNVDEMVNLVETLLNYARLDQAMLKLNKSPCQLNELIEECLKNKTCGGIALSFSPATSPAIIFGDRAYLLILFNNLIENALRYGHSNVAIRIEQTDHHITVFIDDDGPGIDPVELSTIFKPFIRGERHRQTTKGFGMGLAIVSRVCEWHQATLSINQSTRLAGASFQVTFQHSNKKYCL